MASCYQWGMGDPRWVMPVSSCMSGFAGVPYNYEPYSPEADLQVVSKTWTPWTSLWKSGDSTPISELFSELNTELGLLWIKTKKAIISLNILIWLIYLITNQGGIWLRYLLSLVS